MSDLKNAFSKEHLANIFDKCFAEYQYTGRDIPLRQFGLIKTYLWAAFAIIALNGWYYDVLFRTPRHFVVSNWIDWAFLPIFTISPIIAVIVFIIGISSLRGRVANVFVFGKPTAWNRSMDIDQTNQEKIYQRAMKNMEGAMADFRQGNEFRGGRLRLMSRLLVLSAGFAGFVAFYFIYLNTPLKFC